MILRSKVKIWDHRGKSRTFLWPYPQGRQKWALWYLLSLKVGGHTLGFIPASVLKTHFWQCSRDPAGIEPWWAPCHMLLYPPVPRPALWKSWIQISSWLSFGGAGGGCLALFKGAPAPPGIDSRLGLSHCFFPVTLSRVFPVDVGIRDPDRLLDLFSLGHAFSSWPRTHCRIA